MTNLNLLSSTSRVETPFIKVQIGKYVFGVYDKKLNSQGHDAYGNYKLNGITYPNYVKSLTIQKINGTVNTYTLEMFYQIGHNDDPNFFEKVFSSVSDTRRIKFSYGDLSMPYDFSYRDEEAIIMDIKTQFNVMSASLTYRITAVSSAKLTSIGNHTFPATYDKPSNVLKKMIRNNTYGITDLFYGMRNYQKVLEKHCILDDDQKKRLELKTNISLLDYISYLVNNMVSLGVPNNNINKGPIYVMTIVDDTSGEFGGPYIKINKVSAEQKLSDAYEIDIGYPSNNVVTDFSVDDDQTYSIFYKYNAELNQNQYVQRVNDKGELEEVFAPVISSSNSSHITKTVDKNWWTKVTQYPIKATLTLKGLLRPAILMTAVKLNVYYFGRKHVSSGLYIVTKEEDSISEQGFRTKLSLLRVDNVEMED